MTFHSWLTQERLIWHQRFIPSVVAGIAVAIVAFFFQATASNIVMFASLASSAAILSEQAVHHLTILRTVVASYGFALVIGLLSLTVAHNTQLDFTAITLLAVTVSILGMYLFNIFHPPAVAASLSFVMLDGGILETAAIFISVIVLLILIKILTFIFYNQHFTLKRLVKELKRVI